MQLDKWLFTIAGIFVIIVLFAHEYLGASMVLSPLRDANLPENVVWLHHFSWHVGSIMMVAMACLFFLGARDSTNFAMVLIATGMCIGCAGLGLGLAIYESGSLWGTPAPYAWTIASVLGVLGIFFRWKARAA